MKDFLIEFYQFVKERKKYYLIPILLISLLLVGLLVASKGTAVAPFVYTIF